MDGDDEDSIILEATKIVYKIYFFITQAVRLYVLWKWKSTSVSTSSMAGCCASFVLLEIDYIVRHSRTCFSMRESTPGPVLSETPPSHGIDGSVAKGNAVSTNHVQ